MFPRYYNFDSLLFVSKLIEFYLSFVQFISKALLRRHQTVHNGIKEFSCPQCTYETSHKSNLERHCLRVHSLVIESPKQSKQKDNHKKICSTNGSLSSSQSSVSSESELNSSQELVSSHETVAKNSSDSLNSQKSTDNSFVSKNNRIEYKPNRFEDNSLALSQNDCFKIHSFEDMRISDEDSPNHRRVRLCLRPYKCLICWLLFESQLEYFEHQLLTDHMIEDSEQKERLEVIRAAAVLTQIKRSKSHPVLNV